MPLHTDLSQTIIVHAAQYPWVPSPVPGVERRMLFRVGDEVARATSIVRYAPNSHFPRHTHPGGEEILVLTGTFQDEHGDYPAGSYFRNPPGSSHRPASQEGCVLFVRLWQFRQDDHQFVRTALPQGQVPQGHVLFYNAHEEVRIESWEAGQDFTLANLRGLEILVISGDATLGEEHLIPQSWGRFPAGEKPRLTSGPQGIKLWIKEAKLAHENAVQLPQELR